MFPAEIIGKRIRVRLDGTRFTKVHLDKTQQTNIEHKVCVGGPVRGGRGVLRGWVGHMERGSGSNGCGGGQREWGSWHTCG